jgi:hypothetical protein
MIVIAESDMAKRQGHGQLKMKRGMEPSGSSIGP